MLMLRCPRVLSLSIEIFKGIFMRCVIISDDANHVAALLGCIMWDTSTHPYFTNILIACWVVCVEARAWLLV